MTRPRLEELGSDLLKTTRTQRLIALSAPLVWVLGFLIGWESPLRWLICPICLLMVFSASSTSTHDVLHGSLGLRRKGTEWALFLLGAAVLESGHAYRATHLEHHRIFPHHDDIEGEAAHASLARALTAGPLFLFRLWRWAWRHCPNQRVWLAVEAGLLPISLLAAWLLSSITLGPIAFVVASLLSSWLYPTFAVWLPHRDFLNSESIPAWTVRGFLFPRLFRPLAFHLEHHLYPRVPSHHLPELARRLEPWLRQHDVRFVHLP